MHLHWVPHSEEHSFWIQVLLSHLKFLIILFLTCVLQVKSNETFEQLESRGCSVCGSAVPFHLVSTEFRWTYNAQEFTETLSEYKLNMLCLDLSGQECWQLQKRPCFPLEQEHASNSERNDILRNTITRELFVSFLTDVTFLN